MKDYRLYWIWLAQNAGYASKIAASLVNIFGNAAAIYAADTAELEARCVGMNEAELAAAKRIASSKELGEAEDILERATRLGQRVLVPTDADYPQSLRALRDAPMVLYVLGALPRLNEMLSVAVVGTRTMSDSGRRNAYSIGYGLAAGGVVVVSGMALGIDGMAQCGAVSAGGRTVAVLGGGADVIYPRDHESLYNTILKRGAIVSEYPPGTPPVGRHFPVRNRIISGLAAGCVVVEADMKSGALITARHAIYQGRHVFAVPGDVSAAGAQGTNSLIKNGAVMTTSAEDVLNEYEFLYPHSVSMKAYYKAVRGLELEESSRDAMARLRVSARDGDRLYGKGSFGGKSTRGASAGTRNTDKKAPKVSSRDRRHAADGVVFGKSDSTAGSVASTSAAQAKDSTKRRLLGRQSTRDSAADSAREIRAAEESIAAASIPAQRIELDLLDELSIKIYNLMKPDVPMIPDELVTSDISVSDVLSSLSMLELAGAVESGAGGYFLRRSSDDIDIAPPTEE